MPQAKTYNVLGRDLALTRYSGAPSSVNLDTADSWGAVDLAVVPGGRGGLLREGDLRDLGAVDGRANLAQALILRLLTRQGSLAPLGHPQYGSRLTELVGRLNTETTRNLARLFTIEAVKQEPRVRQLLELAVETVPGSPDTIRLSFAVAPYDDAQPLALSLEVTL